MSNSVAGLVVKILLLACGAALSIAAAVVSLHIWLGEGDAQRSQRAGDLVNQRWGVCVNQDYGPGVDLGNIDQVEKHLSGSRYLVSYVVTNGTTPPAGFRPISFVADLSQQRATPADSFTTRYLTEHRCPDTNPPG